MVADNIGLCCSRVFGACNSKYIKTKNDGGARAPTASMPHARRRVEQDGRLAAALPRPCRVRLFCSSDLAAASERRPLVLRNAWEVVTPADECRDPRWFCYSYLVHLGSGKFCIGTFFAKTRSRSRACLSPPSRWSAAARTAAGFRWCSTRPHVNSSASWSVIGCFERALGWSGLI